MHGDTTKDYFITHIIRAQMYHPIIIQKNHLQIISNVIVFKTLIIMHI